MQASGWIQFALYFVALVLITKPMGLYLVRCSTPRARPGSIRCCARSSE